VELPQSAGESQHELDSLELVEPLLRDLIEQRLIRSADSAWAGGSELGLGHVSILGERPVSVAAADEVVFAQEQSGRDSGRAAGRQRVRQVGVFIPIEESQIDPAVGRGNEVVENRALVHTVAAPHPGDDKDFHLSDEA